MWVTLFTIAAVLLLVAVAVALGLRADRARLSGELAEAERQVESLRAANHDLDKQIAEARTKLEGIDDKFKVLANDVLKQTNEQFLQLARKAFDGEQKDAAAQLEHRKQAIESMLKPIREALDKHATAVTTIEKERKQDQGTLRQQLASMLQSQQQLQNQTQNLANALRQTSSRGRWGELSLRRIAEMAGMVEHCDFDEQVTIWTGDERQRPDMVVNLPADRTIIIDAKAPMTAYLDALNADEQHERDRHYKLHLSNVEARINELARKDYGTRLSRAVDFVVLFIPGDSFLTPAVQLKPDMIESALARGVVIATPTTLISLLRVIELGWREQRIAENAQRIRDLGQELHERIAVATGYVDNLGSHLEKAIRSYNQFVGSFDTRVVSSARKFKELGADSAKELPAEGGIHHIETQPRQVKPFDQSLDPTAGA